MPVKYEKIKKRIEEQKEEEKKENLPFVLEEKVTELEGNVAKMSEEIRNMDDAFKECIAEIQKDIKDILTTFLDQFENFTYNLEDQETKNHFMKFVDGFRSYIEKFYEG